jgi:hypothetical protein
MKDERHRRVGKALSTDFESLLLLRNKLENKGRRDDQSHSAFLDPHHLQGGF